MCAYVYNFVYINCASMSHISNNCAYSQQRMDLWKVRARKYSSVSL